VNWWKVAVFATGISSSCVILLILYITHLPLLYVLIPVWSLLALLPFVIDSTKRKQIEQALGSVDTPLRAGLGLLTGTFMSFVKPPGSS
jgi:hypothetical protein